MHDDHCVSEQIASVTIYTSTTHTSHVLTQNNSNTNVIQIALLVQLFAVRTLILRMCDRRLALVAGHWTYWDANLGLFRDGLCGSGRHDGTVVVGRGAHRTA